MKKRLTISILVLFLIGALCACGDKSNRVSFEEKNVSVSIETDKDSYKSGDTIHYKMVIRNDREGWILNDSTFEYTNSDGLVSAGGKLDNVIPELKFDQYTVIEGDLTGDGKTLFIGNIKEKMCDAFSFLKPLEAHADSDKEVELRPYIKVMYGETEVTIRAVMKLTMRQEGVVYSQDKALKYKTVVCHDPSIFLDKDGTYYIVGSFLAGAKSDNLRDWTSLDKEIQGSFTKEQKDLIKAWNKDERANGWNGYLWAPDVVWNPHMNKYCMYLSANGDDWKSNIVMLTADSFTGPYEYQGTIVYGGFTEKDFKPTDVDEILGVDELPERYIKNGINNKKWGDEYPNCIDPCAFFDEEGNLWMSYGSWSGGIFILKLDPETGLRDTSVKYETNEHSDAYFGTKIAGGKYVSGEASYIQHVGEYYYLFVSYGNLEANGGYNIRVFRSKYPDRDYVDALGNDAFYDKYEFNYNQSVGVRLFGAYKWRNFSKGQVAQGHNSAFTDADGKSYIVFHTRTNDGTEGHYVKVHQLFTNKEGWLVAAPYQTNGETYTPGSITTEDMVGSWDILVHDLNVDYKNREVKTSRTVKFTKDGKITGEILGSWSIDEEGSYVTIKLNDTEYSGVALNMKIEFTTVDTLVFTALGDNQITVWGSKNVE